MVKSITNNIQVAVEVAYHNQSTHLPEPEHMFAYRITITNLSDFTYKLIKRHWFITDLNVAKSEVQGEGVVGEQPTLEPGESHQYVSGCALKSGIGNMYGYYTMERLMDGQQLKVKIPKFYLIAPFLKN